MAARKLVNITTLAEMLTTVGVVKGTQRKPKKVNRRKEYDMDYATYYEIYKNVKLEVSSYIHGGGVYIGVYNEEDGPITNLTVNVPGYNLKENEAFIDTNNAPEALDFIKQYKLGKVTEEFAISGFCTYPKVVFDMDKVNKCKGEENGFANSINYDEEEKYA